MWLWYLELYIGMAVAFALGAVLALLLVRLLVRRTTDNPYGGKPADGASTKAPPQVST